MSEENLQEQPKEAPKAAQKKKPVSIWVKLFAVFIIITMVGWAVALYYQGSGFETNSNNNNNQRKPDIEISGYAFYVLPDGSYGTFFESGGGQVPIAFRLDPREAENITLDDAAVPLLLGAKKVYVVTSPNQPEKGKVAVAAAEISRITGVYGIETIGAYTEDSDPPNPNVPLKTCADANGSTVVIYLYVANQTEIKVEGKCVHIVGADYDSLILASDKLGYNLIGIKI